MGFTLLVYVITAFMVKQDWRSILLYTFIPHIDFSSVYLMTMVGFICTTISPYLFFWQASQEVEDRINNGKIKIFGEESITTKIEVKTLGNDTIVGI